MEGADADGSKGDVYAPRPSTNTSDFDDLMAKRARRPRTQSATCVVR